MLQTISAERRAAGGDRRRGPPALRWECEDTPDRAQCIHKLSASESGVYAASLSLV